MAIRSSHKLKSEAKQAAKAARKDGLSAQVKGPNRGVRFPWVVETKIKGESGR